MYAKTLKLYKGVDNTVKFTVLNQEQKPVDLRTATEVISAVIPEGGMGKGYTVGDVLTISGGETGQPAQIVVDQVEMASPFSVYPPGAILAFSIFNPGIYTKVPKLLPNKPTGGTGTGAAFKLILRELSSAEVWFHMLKEDARTILFSRPVAVLNAAKGIVSVTITEGDLNQVPDEFTHYSLAYRKDPLAAYQVMYVDDNYGAQGQAQILTGHYPDHRESVEIVWKGPFHMDASSSLSVTIPMSTNIASTGFITSPGGGLESLYKSEVIMMDAGTKRDNTLHTIQLKFPEPYSGYFSIEATQDPLANFQVDPTGVVWGNVLILPEFVNQTEPFYVNFEGVFTAIRFETYKKNGDTLPTVLYRN